MYTKIIFFKKKTAYEMRISDWSSDVCSSDLLARGQRDLVQDQRRIAARGRPAIPFLIFGALFIFDPINPVAVLLRHAGVRFLDAALHFLKQGLDQPLVRLHRGLEPGIFGLHIGEHVRIVDDRIRSEEHTSELQSLMRNSSAVFCLKKNKKDN